MNDDAMIDQEFYPGLPIADAKHEFRAIVHRVEAKKRAERDEHLRAAAAGEDGYDVRAALADYACEASILFDILAELDGISHPKEPGQ